MAKVVAEVSLHVDRPVREVFEFLAQPANMAQWVSGVVEAQFLQRQKPGRGAKYSMKYNYGGRVNDLTMETTAFDRYSRIAFKTVEGPYPIAGVYSLAPSGSGTQYTYNQTALSDSPITAFMFLTMGCILKFPMRKLLQKDALKLKAAIETPAPQDPEG